MSSDELEIALPEARDLVKALELYAFTKRRDELLRREQPQDTWAIGENDRDFLPLHTRVRHLHRRLSSIANEVGERVILLNEGVYGESLEKIKDALDAARSLLAALESRVTQ